MIYLYFDVSLREINLYVQFVRKWAQFQYAVQSCNVLGGEYFINCNQSQWQLLLWKEVWGRKTGGNKYSKVLRINLAVPDPEYKIVHKGKEIKTKERK